MNIEELNKIILDGNKTEKDFSFTYTDDCNLLEIHKYIISKLTFGANEEMAKLSLERNKELEKIKQKQSLIDRNYSLKRIDFLNKKITELNGILFKKYLNDISDILADYQKIGPLRKIVSFMTSTSTIANNTDMEDKRHEIISKFLNIATKYVKLNIVRSTPTGYSCRECGSDLTNSLITADNGITRCSHCWTEHINLLTGVEDAESSTFSNTYEDRKTFIKAIVNYQGKQPNKLGNIEERLDKYFMSISYPSGQEVRKLPLNKDGSRGKTSRDLLFSALKESGLSIYYEDDWLICHEYWGWTLPDVSHLEETLLTDYDLSQPYYDKYKGDRKSNMNNQYRLFRHLERLGHNCLPDDFRMVRTAEILNFYEEVWIKMCKELNWTLPTPIAAYPQRLNSVEF